MEFMEQSLDKPDLLAQVTQGLKLQEKHLVYLELMIMEQVADWEIGVGRAEQDSGWDKPSRLVVTLPNGSTKTIGISQGTQKRYWFGICPVSFKIGNLKLCSGCKVVGYVGKEEQVNSKLIFLVKMQCLNYFFIRNKIGPIISLYVKSSKVYENKI